MTFIVFSCALQKCTPTRLAGLYALQFTIGRTNCRPLPQTSALRGALPQLARKPRKPQ